MTIRTLVSRLVKAEGKKSQIKIGDMREVVGILSDILYEEFCSGGDTTFDNLLNNGNKRSRRRK